MTGLTFNTQHPVDSGHGPNRAKIKVKGQLVQKIEKMETNDPTDMTDRIIFPAHMVGKHILPLRFTFQR